MSAKSTNIHFAAASQKHTQQRTADNFHNMMNFLINWPANTLQELVLQHTICMLRTRKIRSSSPSGSSDGASCSCRRAFSLWVSCSSPCRQTHTTHEHGRHRNVNAASWRLDTYFRKKIFLSVCPVLLLSLTLRPSEPLRTPTTLCPKPAHGNVRMSQKSSSNSLRRRRTL